MKKISLALVLVFIFSLFTIGCGDANSENGNSNYEFRENENNGYAVIVYGKDISSNCYVKENSDENFVELSIFPILKEMGGVIEWKSSTEVEITFGENLYNRKYTLDVENHTLFREGRYFDYFAPIPGGTHGNIHYLTDCEYIVDNDLFRILLVYDLNSYLSVDMDEKTITVTKREGDPIWE